MQHKDLDTANEVLGWLAKHSSDLQEPLAAALGMAASFTLARAYLSEYQTHLSHGMEPYEALQATAHGTLVLTQRQRDFMRATMPPPDCPT